MERWVSLMAALLFIEALFAASCVPSEAAISKGSFEDNFSIMWSEEHFKTSEDGQIWYLSLDKETGIETCSFMSQYSKLLIYVAYSVYVVAFLE